jgi:rhamnosyltransferase
MHLRTMINAIVTLYNPDKSVIEHVKEYAAQTDRVILCDNSSDDHSEMFKDIPSVVYTTEHKNLGLSGAFNRVLKDEKYGWSDNDFIIFFDQDSSIKENHIQTLIKDFEKLEKKGYRVGCIGPVFFNTSKNAIEEPKLKKDISATIYQVNNTITSSLLSKYWILEKVGFFNDEVFLDFVDWDLCWRMGAHGYGVFMTKSVVLGHSVGSGEKRVGPISLRVGAPSREYYQTRDALFLMRKSYVPAKMKLRLWANVYVRPTVHRLFMDDWDVRKHYIERGREDYKKHINGPYLEK